MQWKPLSSPSGQLVASHCWCTGIVILTLSPLFSFLPSLYRIVVCWSRLLSQWRFRYVCQSFLLWMLILLPSQHMRSNLYMVNLSFMLCIFFRALDFVQAASSNFLSNIFVLCQRCTPVLMHVLCLSYHEQWRGVPKKEIKRHSPTWSKGLNSTFQQWRH